MDEEDDDEDEVDEDDDEELVLAGLELELPEVLDEELAPEVEAGAFESEVDPLPELRESVR